MSFIDNLMEQTAQGATAELTGGAIGQIFGALNDNRQLTQQRHLQNLQLEGQKGMMDYAYQKQLDMWNQTNYPAQMQQLEKAGLNPGLMYAKGGPGGVTGTPAGNVTGGQAQQNPGEATAAMGIMNQNALIESQRKLTEAQAHETNVRADKEAGVDTNVGKAQETNLIQQAKTSEAQQKLTEIQTKLTTLDKQFQEQTFDSRMEMISREVEKMYGEAVKLNNENGITRATMEQQIQTIKQKSIEAILTNAAIETNITKTQSEIQQIAQNILQGWTDLDIKQQQIQINKFLAEFQAGHPGIMNVLGGAIQRIANAAAKPLTDATTKIPK